MSKAKGRAALSGNDRRQDDALVKLVQGINLLIAQATADGLGTAARILHTAKEDLVYWGVSMNFHETAEERFINRYLYDAGLLNAQDLLRYLEKQPAKLPVPTTEKARRKKS